MRGGKKEIVDLNPTISETQSEADLILAAASSPLGWMRLQSSDPGFILSHRFCEQQKNELMRNQSVVVAAHH